MEKEEKKMSLPAQEKALFAPQVVSLPANAEELNSAGFKTCITGNRPCVYAVAIYPHRDSDAIMLCCRSHGRTVSAGEAAGCTRQA